MKNLQIAKARVQIAKMYLDNDERRMANAELKSATLDANHHTHYQIATSKYYDLEMTRTVDTVGYKDALTGWHKIWEHIIPVNMYTAALEDNNDELLESLLNACTIIYVTVENDTKLTEAGYRRKMPEEFYDKASNMYMNPWARYMKCAIDIYDIDTGLKVDMKSCKATIKGIK